VNLKYKKLTFLALSVSLAMILSFVESLIPPLAMVPGVKIGLANIVTVFLLYTLGIRAAGAVSLVRVLLSALLFGNVQSLIFALSGALLSFVVMIVAKHLLPFGTVGVSVLGAIAHNAGQIIAAVIVMETVGVAYYFIPLVISGTLGGVLVGIVAAVITKRLQKII
jgi:heptaprenyl diphosphate synthase